MIDQAVEYAFSFLGSRYTWGGDTPMGGFDCSGFVQEILASIGMDPVGDQTAQDLFNIFSKQGLPQTASKGCLAFYGKDTSHIIHVAFCINDSQVIEAGGGGSLVKTLDDAIDHKAYVRIRLIKYRSDFVGLALPRYT